MNTKSALRFTFSEVIVRYILICVKIPYRNSITAVRPILLHVHEICN